MPLAGVTTVAFDVGETLVDESRYWAELGSRAGLPAHVVWSALGATIVLGRDHRLVWHQLGVATPPVDGLTYEPGDLYADAASTLRAIRATGRRVVVVGNQPVEMSSWGFLDALEVDLVATSDEWGVRKPAPGFFERLVATVDESPARIAYVGDRLDLDVAPARRAGLVAVHVRRGPWGLLQRPLAGDGPDVVVDTLAELATLFEGEGPVRPAS